MRLPTHIAALAVASFALLVTAASATAKPRRITGKLSSPGYTVLALAPNGKAKTVRARPGGFRLRPPAASVTLHLRTANGTYAGPIVVRRKGRRALVRVRAGARLGTIEVREGYATPTRQLRRKWFEGRRWARARRGIPVGAGNFGLVRSRPVRRAVRGDLDLDGVPNTLDVDSDGDLILNPIDRRPRRYGRRSAHKAAIESGTGVDIASDMWVDIAETANANAGSSEDEIDQGLAAKKTALTFQIAPGGTVELDCGQPQSRTDPTLGGLAYCTKGGTGTIADSAGPIVFQGGRYSPFPDCCDDGDGFGTLTPARSDQYGSWFELHPRATSTQIGTGDILIQRVTTGGVETPLPFALPFVFSTNPALVSYRDSAGNAATVTYPVAGASGAGTQNNPFPAAASGGKIVLTLTLWRPQRRPIPPAPDGTGGDACLRDTPACKWVDIGGLTYTTGAHRHTQTENFDLPSQTFCPQDAYSTADPILYAPAWPSGPDQPNGLTDRALDGPANPANMLTFTVDVTKCLKSKGLRWDPGQVLVLDIQARTGSSGTFGAATQNFTFRRER